MIPFPLILSAPSGGGKTRIAHELLQRRRDVGYSVSCTTRAPREGERDGVDYHFLSRASFEAERSRGGLAEWAEVHGHLYGTLRSEVERVLRSGKHVVMDIDVQGTIQFSGAFPQSVLVFVLPPSGAVLVERLIGRKSENPASLLTRLRAARAELGAVDQYQYVVVNEDLGKAVESLCAIIDAETMRRDRIRALDQQVDRLIAQLDQAIQFHTKE